MPEMRRVFSSHVERIGYDPDTQELHVHFRGSANTPDRMVIYSNVPPSKGNAVLSAPSIGTALHFNIRGGDHPFTTVPL